jgi:hypothetical protein
MPEPKEIIIPQNTVNLQETADGLECAIGVVPSNDGVLREKKFKIPDETLSGNKNWYDSMNHVINKIKSNKQVVYNQQDNLVILESGYRGTLSYNNEIVAVNTSDNKIYKKKPKKALVPAFLKILFRYKVNDAWQYESHNYYVQYDTITKKVYNGIECQGYNDDIPNKKICPSGNKIFTIDPASKKVVKFKLDRKSNTSDNVKYISEMVNENSAIVNYISLGADVLNDGGNGYSSFYLNGMGLSQIAKVSNGIITGASTENPLGACAVFSDVSNIYIRNICTAGEFNSTGIPPREYYTVPNGPVAYDYRARAVMPIVTTPPYSPYSPGLWNIIFYANETDNGSGSTYNNGTNYYILNFSRDEVLPRYVIVDYGISFATNAYPSIQGSGTSSSPYYWNNRRQIWKSMFYYDATNYPQRPLTLLPITLFRSSEAISRYGYSVGYYLKSTLYWIYDTTSKNWKLVLRNGDYSASDSTHDTTLFTCYSPKTLTGDLKLQMPGVSNDIILNSIVMRPQLLWAYYDDTNDPSNPIYHFVYFIKTMQSEYSSVIQYYIMDIAFKVNWNAGYPQIQHPSSGELEPQITVTLLEDLSSISNSLTKINISGADQTSVEKYILDFSIPLLPETLNPPTTGEYDTTVEFGNEDIRAIVPSLLPYPAFSATVSVEQYASLTDSFIKLGSATLTDDGMNISSEGDRIVIYLELDNDVYNMNLIRVNNTTYGVGVIHEASLYPSHTIINPNSISGKEIININALDVYNFLYRLIYINSSSPNEILITSQASYIPTDVKKFTGGVIEIVPVSTYAYIFTTDGIYIMFDNNGTLMFEKISDMKLYEVVDDSGNPDRNYTTAIQILDGCVFIGGDKKLYFAKGTIIKELNINGINDSLLKTLGKANLSKIKDLNILLVTANVYEYSGGYIGRYFDKIDPLISPERTMAIDMVNGVMYNFGVYVDVARQTESATYRDRFYGTDIFGIGKFKRYYDETGTGGWGRFDVIEGIAPHTLVGTKPLWAEDGTPSPEVEHVVDNIKVIGYRIVADVRLVKTLEKAILMMDSEGPASSNDIVIFTTLKPSPKIHDFFNWNSPSIGISQGIMRSNVAYVISDGQKDIESYVMRPQSQFQRIKLIINLNRKDKSFINVYGIRVFVVPRTLWY